MSSISSRGGPKSGCLSILALTPVDLAYPGGIIRLHPSLAAIDSGVPQAREQGALRWLRRGEVQTLDWASADRPVLEELWR